MKTARWRVVQILEIFAEKHGLKIGTIADLIHYRMTNEQTVERIGSAKH